MNCLRFLIIICCTLILHVHFTKKGFHGQLHERMYDNLQFLTQKLFFNHILFGQTAVHSKDFPLHCMWKRLFRLQVAAEIGRCAHDRIAPAARTSVLAPRLSKRVARAPLIGLRAKRHIRFSRRWGLRKHSVCQSRGPYPLPQRRAASLNGSIPGWTYRPAFAGKFNRGDRGIVIGHHRCPTGIRQRQRAGAPLSRPFLGVEPTAPMPSQAGRADFARFPHAPVSPPGPNRLRGRRAACHGPRPCGGNRRTAGRASSKAGICCSPGRSSVAASAWTVCV